MAKVLKEQQGKVLIYGNKAFKNPEPTKSWFYVTEYDSKGFPYKAKTLNCSGEMPYDYMYGTYNSNYRNVASRNLREFEINEGVTKIGQYAFENCLSLTSITIPKSITSIGYNAFMSCSNLLFVKIKSIESWCKISFSSQTSNPVFYARQLYLNEEKVTDLLIPSSITTIKAYAFIQCNSLTSITIPDSVTSIENSAFDNCTGLTNIAIPNSVTSIGRYVFYGCSSLTSITIGNSVTSIEDSTFSQCKSLASITIGKSITSIGSSAFYGCSSCLLYDFRGATQVPTLSSINAFQGTSSSKKIVVPDSLYDEWITATNWSSTDYNIVSSIIKASDYEASL